MTLQMWLEKGVQQNTGKVPRRVLIQKAEESSQEEVLCVLFLPVK